MHGVSSTFNIKLVDEKLSMVKNVRPATLKKASVLLWAKVD